ncbi:MAG: acyltransferase family protein [Candidatus Accumulibacter sp. UW25]|jgi:peptidoglycan/LPS O-acetylase OafA/YrhL
MLPPHLTAPDKYRPDIDGLRAIAIIPVVFYHADFPGFSGGFVGVDVFFVISGFLITALLFNEAVATGSVSLSTFYARRVRRLMPASLLVVVVTVLLGALFMPPASVEQRSLARSAMALAFFVSNFYFFTMTEGYFDDPSFTLPLLHTWSLAVEEQYYLVWPLIMLLLFHFFRTSQEEGRMRRRVQVALVMMGTVSLALCVASTPNARSFAFYLLPSRVWEFALGGLVGLSGAAFQARLRGWGNALAVVGLALIVASVLLFDTSTPFPGWAATLPVSGSAALIAGMTANRQGVVSRLLACRPMVFIGLLSYSWYLWHWPLLSLYRIHHLGDRDVTANVVLVTLALGLAWLTYVWVERPIRVRRPWLFLGVRPTLLAGGAMSMMMLFTAAGLWAWRYHQGSTESYRWVMEARSDRVRNPLDCSIPARPAGDLPFEECSSGADKHHPRILLWGDSHALHLLPMLTEAFPDRAVYQLTRPACMPLIVQESSTSEANSCLEFNQRVLQEILALKKNGLESVVIAARWALYFGYPAVPDVRQAGGSVQADAAIMAQLRADVQGRVDATLAALERAGLRVLVIAPIPGLAYSAPQCIALRGEAQCHASRQSNQTALMDATAALAEIVIRHPNTRLIEPIANSLTEQEDYV